MDTLVPHQKKKKNDLCPDCIQALTDFIEAPQRIINDSKKSLTPDIGIAGMITTTLVTGTIGQVDTAAKA